MHELRSIVSEGRAATLVAKRAPKQRREENRGPSLAGLAIPRTESRTGNQRREDRHLNLAERAELRFRRARLEVGLVNVSNHGAMIESDIEPRIGERLQIAFDGCNRIDCAVRWVREGRIGLEFAHETEIIASARVRDLIVSGRRAGEQQPPEPQSTPPEPTVPRREPRQSLLWKAVLHWDHGTLPVRLRNISAEGAMLEAPDDLPAETGVVLDLSEGGAISGLVRWSRSGQIGVRFDERFDLSRLVRSEAPHDSSPSMMKPVYLESELDPDSPWAAAWDKFGPEDLDDLDAA